MIKNRMRLNIGTLHIETHSGNLEMSFQEVMKLNHIPAPFYIHHQRAEVRDKGIQMSRKNKHSIITMTSNSESCCVCPETKIKLE